MQRLRLTFSRGREVRYISHLDLMRLWQRAFRRADLPLTYSHGFSPHPKLSLAAPLAIGVTSSAELINVYLNRRISPYFFVKTISKQLPPGIDISEAVEVGAGMPSLQSQVLHAEYQVVIESDRAPGDVAAAVRDFLDKETLPWQHSRDTEVRRYDLRALVDDVWLIDCSSGRCILGMRLYCDKRGTGRPEQVLSALGFEGYPETIHRTGLVLAGNRQSEDR